MNIKRASLPTPDLFYSVYSALVYFQCLTNESICSYYSWLPKNSMQVTMNSLMWPRSLLDSLCQPRCNFVGLVYMFALNSIEHTVTVQRETVSFSTA